MSERRKLHVNWEPSVFMDYDKGGWAQVETDTAHDWGLTRTHERKTRKDQQRAWYNVRGHDGEITSNAELFRVLEELGHIPKEGHDDLKALTKQLHDGAANPLNYGIDWCYWPSEATNPRHVRVNLLPFGDDVSLNVFCDLDVPMDGSQWAAIVKHATGNDAHSRVYKAFQRFAHRNGVKRSEIVAFLEGFE